MHAFKCTGLLDADPSSHILPRSWTELTRLALASKMGGSPIPADPRSLESALSHVVPDAEHRERAWDALQWFGLVPPASSTSSPSTGRAEQGMPPLPTKPLAPIDLLTAVLSHKLRYEPGERDLVVLAHEIVAAPSGAPDVTQTHTEVYTSTLMSYGTACGSAMSRCVGLPVAFATLAVLDGRVAGRGVQGPTEESLYRAVLDGLKGVGLEMKEGVRRGSGLEVRLGDGLHGTGFTPHAKGVPGSASLW